MLASAPAECLQAMQSAATFENNSFTNSPANRTPNCRSQLSTPDLHNQQELVMRLKAQNEYLEAVNAQLLAKV